MKAKEKREERKRRAECEEREEEKKEAFLLTDTHKCRFCLSLSLFLSVSVSLCPERQKKRHKWMLSYPPTITSSAGKRLTAEEKQIEKEMKGTSLPSLFFYFFFCIYLALFFFSLYLSALERERYKDLTLGLSMSETRTSSIHYQNFPEFREGLQKGQAQRITTLKLISGIKTSTTHYHFFPCLKKTPQKWEMDGERDSTLTYPHLGEKTRES